MTENDKFVGKKGASRAIGLSPRSIDYARSRGELPFYKVRGRVLFKGSDLTRFMERYRVDVSEVE